MQPKQMAGDISAQSVLDKRSGRIVDLVTLWRRAQTIGAAGCHGGVSRRRSVALRHSASKPVPAVCVCDLGAVGAGAGTR